MTKEKKANYEEDNADDVVAESDLLKMILDDEPVDPELLARLDIDPAKVRWQFKLLVRAFLGVAEEMIQAEKAAAATKQAGSGKKSK